MQTIIEIKPHGDGWKVFEAVGVEPVFPTKDYALTYAQGRTAQRQGEIRILNAKGGIEETIPFHQESRSSIGG